MKTSKITRPVLDLAHRLRENVRASTGGKSKPGQSGLRQTFARRGTPAAPDAQGASCLVVAHNYHPAVGAAAARLRLVTEELQARGIRVTVLTSSTSQELAGPAGERVVGTDRRWMPRSRLFGTAVLAVRAAASAANFDVVLSDPPPHVAFGAMTGARLGRKPGVFYFCDSWASVASSRGGRAWDGASQLFGALEGQASRLASATVASTPALVERARRTSNQVELVRNGTDLAVYTAEGPAWQGTPLPQRYFLYAGTMGLVHGADVFVEAAQRLWGQGADFGLVFVGSGAEAAPIREAAAASQGRIVFMDPVSPSEVAALLRGSTGALSSMRPVPGYEDAWPVKTLAAMACGAIPVYVSGGDLADELAAQELAFVEPYGVEGAERALSAALALGEQQRAEMCARCRSHAAEHFDQRRAASSVAGLVARLVEDNARGHRR